MLGSKVYICGPIANRGQPANGGFQSCNRRTVDALQDRGVQVTELRYAQPRAPQALKIIRYLLNFAALTMRVLAIERRSILHMTALKGPFIYPEVVLAELARIRGARIVFDIRAGYKPEQFFQDRSWLYRRFFSRALRSADLVLVEGQELIPFVSSLRGEGAVVLPNHIDTTSAPLRISSVDDATPLVIAFVGSVIPEKGIETALETVAILHRDGVPAQLKIAGAGPPRFVSRLRHHHRSEPVIWLGSMASDDVLKLLASSHFFIYPTRWPGEGQSNALTEALACGCVPIVSDHGFNAATGGRCGAVLDSNATAADYAQAIRCISESGRWKQLSDCARARAVALFSTDRVADDLISLYSSLESVRP